MATMDIFDANAFTTFSMTQALNREPYLPQFLGSLNLFESEPVMTDKIAIEERTSKLSLIQTSPIGAPPIEITGERRKIRDFRTVRIATKVRVTASEIRNVRAFGSESELMTIQADLARRMANQRRAMELTHENMRLGAVQGIVVDADATVLNNWYTEFGVTQPTEIDFDLDAASPASGVVRKKCAQVVRAMQTAAQGAWVPGLTSVMGIAGDAFWDDLIAHTEVRQTYLNTVAASDLRQGSAYETLSYGGITFLNYRGTDDGSTVAVGTDKCKFFPVGAPGLFKVAWSPAEPFDWVGTPGQPIYAIPIRDKDRNAWFTVEMYSYPLYVCTTPLMLQSARRT